MRQAGIGDRLVADVQPVQLWQVAQMDEVSVGRRSTSKINPGSPAAEVISKQSPQPQRAQVVQRCESGCRRRQNRSRTSRLRPRRGSLPQHPVVGVPDLPRRPARRTSTVTTTNIVANENCAHRRFGVIMVTSLARGLAMPISIPRRRAAGKGVRPSSILLAQRPATARRRRCSRAAFACL